MKSLALALALALVAAALGARRRRRPPHRRRRRRRHAAQRAPRATPDAVPAKPAAPVAQPAAPATAARRRPPRRKRSWMGPIAGLAAGLGIAALMSHLGLGDAFGNILTMVLLAVVAIVAIRFLMRRFGRDAGGRWRHAVRRRRRPVAQAPLSFPDERPAQYRGDARRPRGGRAAAPPRCAGRCGSLPAGFDADGFERIAKMIFIRLQAANDSGDLNDLRAFTTPEMFAAIQLDLQERGPTAQRTDVVRVDAEVLDVASEADRQIVSVRFHGLIREEDDGVAEPFDEVWHLVKPADGSREWAIAGIQQTTPALA